MAFPVIASTAESVQSANVTSHPITMPSGITAGHLLIVAFANDGSATVTVPGDWTQMFSNANGTTCRLTVVRKVAAGGDSLSLTTSAGEHSAAYAMRITGAHASTVPVNGTATTGASANPNPPALNPATWDVEDTLWIAVTGMDGAGSLTSGPASYSAVGDGYARGTGSAANSALVAIFQRNNAIASEDPGTFVLTSEDWVANTIAVRPAPPTVQIAGTSDAVAEMAGVTNVAKALVGACEAVAEHAGRVRRLDVIHETFDKPDGGLGPALVWQRQVFSHDFPASVINDEMRLEADVGGIPPAGIYEEIQVPTTVPAATVDAAVEVVITDIDFTGSGDSVNDWGGILRYVPRDNNTNYRGYASAFGRNNTFVPPAEIWHVILFRIDGVGDATLLGPGAFALGPDVELPATFRFQIQGDKLIAHADHSGTGPPLHTEVTDATYSDGVPSSGGSLQIPTGGTGSITIDDYRVFFFDAVTLESAAGQRPQDVYDAGNAGTLPADVYDAGNSAVRPTDIYDANISNATDEAVAEHVGLLSADRAIAAASDAVAEMAADLSVEAGGETQIAGSMDAVAEHAAALDVTKSLTGLHEAVGQTFGAVTVARDLVGASDAVGEHVADLTVRNLTLNGSSDAVAEMVADLTIHGTVFVQGAAEAVAEHIGALTLQLAMLATSDSVAEHEGLLGRTLVFAGSTDTVAQFVANLSLVGLTVHIPPPRIIVLTSGPFTVALTDHDNRVTTTDPDNRISATSAANTLVAVDSDKRVTVVAPDNRITRTDHDNRVEVETGG